MSHPTLHAALFLSVIAACGAESNRQTDDDDDVTADGGVADSGSTACGARADYGTLPELLDVIALDRPDIDENGTIGNSHVAFSVGVADTDHLVMVALNEGSGRFLNGITPGTYSIQGDHTEIKDCGLCIGISVSSGSTRNLLMAMTGSVTIERFVPDGDDPRLTGSLDMLDLRLVDSEGNEVEGCASKVSSLAFDLEVMRDTGTNPGE